jgi:GDP-L-fucose synthase
MSFWKGKKVLVTGGRGFIGRYVVAKLHTLGASVTVPVRKPLTGNNILEFREIQGDCSVFPEALRMTENIDIVINMAARVAGIEYNRNHQATMLTDNMEIARCMLEAARINGVKRFLTVSSACVYPSDAKIPTPEIEGMRGEPEPTNGGYGWAKRYCEILSKYYSEQYGMHIGIVRPYNAYGPGDHFDDPSSHVIPALISRIISGENPFTVWGSGRQTRSFLYAQDLAQGILLGAEKYPVADPVNLGSEEEVTISRLVNMICELSGKHPKLVFDTTKPDGSPRRKSDNQKAKTLLGFEGRTPLYDGLRMTIDWYLKQKTIRT